MIYDVCIVSVNARLNVNVALNRPSYQISTYEHPEPYCVLYARYGNDGNRDDTNYISGPCAHTHVETNPWWAVDLGVALHVDGVKFTNRGDCCNTHATSGSSVAIKGKTVKVVYTVLELPVPLVGPPIDCPPPNKV